MAKTTIVPIDPHYLTSTTRRRRLRERPIHVHNQQPPRPVGPKGNNNGKENVILWSQDALHVYNPDNLMMYQPRYPMSHLGLLLAEALERYQWGDSFMKYVPVRLGSSRLMDCSAQALMRCSVYVSTKSPTFKAASMRHYGEAIDCLQTLMSSKSFKVTDEVMLAVSLLSAYEMTLGTSLEDMYSHSQGIDALLRRCDVSEMGRCMIFHYHTVTFLMPVANGTASPYDKQKWLELDPPSGRRLATPAGIKLHKFSNQLFIRLPKLIVLVRKFRTSPDDHIAATTCALAQDLLELADQTAENEMLHVVNVTNTVHNSAEDSVMPPVSFIFRSYPDFQAMAYYWQTRLLLLRLCRRFALLYPDKPPLMPLDAIANENARLSTNILMTWEPAFALRTFGTGKGGTGKTAYMSALITLWGFLMDVETFRGMPSAMAKEWIVQRLHGLLNHRLRITPAQMDEMAELFCGGPVKGLLPSLFHPPVK